MLRNVFVHIEISGFADILTNLTTVEISSLTLNNTGVFLQNRLNGKMPLPVFLQNSKNIFIHSLKFLAKFNTSGSNVKTVIYI